MYSKERNEILQTLNEILGIMKENKCFYVHTLETNKEIQQKLKDLVPKVKMYFKSSDWFCFKKEEIDVLSLVKAVYKDMRYKLDRKPTNYFEDGKLISTNMYIIL